MAGAIPLASTVIILLIGITRSLRKKEKAEHYGEHADYFCLFFHQATLL